MNLNPRIHRPSAKSFSTGGSSTMTITQSSALWKALKHREEAERLDAELKKEPVTGGFLRRVGHAIGRLFTSGERE